MYNLKSASLAGVAGVCLAFSVLSANAAEAATQSGCVDSAKQVRAALEANPQSPNYDAAVKEKRYGLEYCNTGLYRQGVEHYTQALKLLDPDKS